MGLADPLRTAREHLRRVPGAISNGSVPAALVEPDRDPALAEALRELRPAQLPFRLAPKLAEDREVGERNAVGRERVVDVASELRAREREVEHGVECIWHASNISMTDH